MAGEELAYFANTDKISAYNEAQFKIKRLHDSWVLCNTYRRQGKNEALQWELDTIWDEISDDVRKKEKNPDGVIEDIDKKILTAKKLMYDASADENQRRNGASSYYQCLRLKYRKLKEYQNLVGMGGKYKSAADDEPMDE